jgi:DnaD/phage-associated family protein
MKQFTGFPSRMDYAAVPAVFFSSLLPQITDIAELKTTLHLFHLLLSSKRSPRYVTFHELAADANVVSSLRACGKPVEETLRGALEMAVARGTALHLCLEHGVEWENIYMLNTTREREAALRIKNGELQLPGLSKLAAIPEPPQPPRTIFELYEQNIGLLTPIIAEELKDAEKNYPPEWIQDAFREAVNANKRSWRYISRMLERWATEGKKDGTYPRDLKAADPDRFVKGRYGHLFQR